MVKIQVNSQGKAYYTSAGKVLLAPEGGGGEKVEAENLSGANISEGGKVWINSYSYDEGDETQITPVSSSYIHNSAMYLVAADGQSYIVRGDNNSTPRGNYRTLDNTLISSTGFSTNTKIIPNPNDGGSSFIAVSGAATSSSSVIMHSYTGSTTLNSVISRIIFNAPWLMVKIDTSTNPATYTLAEYNLASRTLINETPIEITDSIGAQSANIYAGVKLDDENILIVMSYNSAKLFTYDSTLNKWGFTRTVSINNVASNNYTCDFVTSDGKYMHMGYRLCYLGDVLSGGDITSTSFSDIANVGGSPDNCCIANGNTFKLLVQKTIDSKTYNLVYNYNSETGNFDQVAIDSDNPDTNQFAGCDADMNYQVFIRPYSGTKYNAYLVSTEAITGNFLVSYAPSNITINTQTGIAAENIAAGSTGLVNVGAVIEPTGTLSITANGIYDVTNYASADVSVSGGGSGTTDVPLTRFKDDTNTEIGTHYMNFTDGNGNEYKVIVLDAQYRNASTRWCSSTAAVTNMPLYSDLKTSNVWEAKETATQNTQFILDYCSAGGYTSTACSHCRSQSFTVGGTTYYGQLPNCVEVVHLAKHYNEFNLMDTSASSHSSTNFNSSRNIWSSSQYTTSFSWRLGGDGYVDSVRKSSSYFTCPILEIPVSRGNMNLSWSMDYIYSVFCSIKVNDETVATSGSSSISETLIGSYPTGSVVNITYGCNEALNGTLKLYINDVMVDSAGSFSNKTYSFTLEENTLVRIVYENSQPGPEDIILE